MGRRITIDMFPSGVDERILRRGDLCDKKVMQSILGTFEDINDSDGIIQNRDAYTKHYVGNVRVYHTFCRSNDSQPYYYAGLCEWGEAKNLHPQAAQRVFIITQYHAETQDGLYFNTRFAKAVARRMYTELGDLPVVPRLYFPTFMSDEKTPHPSAITHKGIERDFGIEAGHILMSQCDRAYAAVIGGNISDGMRADIDYATLELALPVKFRHFTMDEAWKYIKETETEMYGENGAEYR